MPRFKVILIILRSTEEKDLGIWVTSNLTWSKHTLDRCPAANRMLGFVRRSATEITDKRIRRALYLAVVRPALGYATQVWSVELINRVERVQRRASKFILGLPFMCDVSYKDRLISTELLPLSYWHEYLDFSSKLLLALYRYLKIPYRSVLLP